MSFIDHQKVFVRGKKKKKTAVAFDDSLFYYILNRKDGYAPKRNNKSRNVILYSQVYL